MRRHRCDNRERDLDLLLGDIAGFCRVLCLDGSRGGRSCLASECVEDCSLAVGFSPVTEPSSPVAAPVVAALAAGALPESETSALPGRQHRPRPPCPHSVSQPEPQLGNALGALGPQLSRRGAKGHREGQECHQPRLATPRAIAPRRCETRWRSSTNISICLPLSVLGALP